MGSHWEYWSPPKWGSEMVLLFLLLSAAITLSGGAPQTHRQIRAAPAFENVCKAAEEAYRGGESFGKVVQDCKPHLCQDLLCPVLRLKDQRANILFIIISQNEALMQPLQKKNSNGMDS